MDPKPLNRQQLAKICGNDPEAIRLMERLFLVAGVTIPGEIDSMGFGAPPDVPGAIDALRVEVQGFAELVQRAVEIVASNDLQSTPVDAGLAQRVADLELQPPVVPYTPAGASGTFTTADAKTVTVVNGIVTSIV